ncbi:MAG: preprotein translocase subunit YajC [Oxalobacteraceae bacterium]|nr:MAG: preprotein translocase subunit YajC [Oxalobacteraceae bacterium]
MQSLLYLPTLVVAQATPDSPAGVFGNILPFILMFAVLYFLLIRPSNKERQAEQQMLSTLKKDDEIVTKGGLYGRIVTLDETVVTLEIADRVKVKMMRKSIAGPWQAQAVNANSRNS